MLLYRPFLFLSTAILCLTATLAAPPSTPSTHNPPAIRDISYPSWSDDNEFLHRDTFKGWQARMPSKWSGQATIEVTMLSNTEDEDSLNSMGNVTGSNLYGTIYEALKQMCVYGNSDYCTGIRYFPTNQKKGKGPAVTPSTEFYDIVNIVVADSHYESEQILNLLIGTIAGVYEAATNLDWNCFFVADAGMGYWYCNVPRMVSAHTENSTLTVLVLGANRANVNAGQFHCCSTRQPVDAKLDPLLNEFKSVYPTDRSMVRNVQCDKACDNGQAGDVNVDQFLIMNMKSGM